MAAAIAAMLNATDQNEFVASGLLYIVTIKSRDEMKRRLTTHPYHVGASNGSRKNW